MLEKAFSGGRKYWALIGILSLFLLAGFLAYLKQYNEGLVVTGLSRDVPWGFYIAQFTFLVGVAASAVMVVLPYYLHNYREFGKITVLGAVLFFQFSQFIKIDMKVLKVNVGFADS